MAAGTIPLAAAHQGCLKDMQRRLKEEQSVHGSDDEEVDEPLERDSDEDLSDDGSKQVDEEEGLCDEESTKSDEEYDDLAMLDIQEDGYMTDVNEEIYQKSELSNKPPPSYTFLKEKNEKRVPTSGNARVKKMPQQYSNPGKAWGIDKWLHPPGRIV
ncbi:hypothetical protein HAX54_043254 [Datura stramonium]|uniref:Uncharacterized protein n=1 Tax=Datura stramonium TaxID=4076 RepID=A0ABS8SMX6_DATST|nr:hypothetical protein [Datura stramonium]